MAMSSSLSTSMIVLTRGTLTACWTRSPMMSFAPTVMDGGYVHGREAVRAYWTRQWAMVSPHVEPVTFHRTADGAIIAEVRHTIGDLEGRPLQGQTHGLKDKTVGHVFRLEGGRGGSRRHKGC